MVINYNGPQLFIVDKFDRIIKLYKCYAQLHLNAITSQLFNK